MTERIHYTTNRHKTRAERGSAAAALVTTAALFGGIYWAGDVLIHRDDAQDHAIQDNFAGALDHGRKVDVLEGGKAIVHYDADENKRVVIKNPVLFEGAVVSSSGRTDPVGKEKQAGLVEIWRPGDVNSDYANGIQFFNMKGERITEEQAHAVAAHEKLGITTKGEMVIAPDQEHAGEVVGQAVTQHQETSTKTSWK